MPRLLLLQPGAYPSCLFCVLVRDTVNPPEGGDKDGGMS